MTTIKTASTEDLARAALDRALETADGMRYVGEDLAADLSIYRERPALRVEEPVSARRAALPQCTNYMPAEAGAGHWREWHRGHGCHLDPDAVGEVES